MRITVSLFSLKAQLNEGHYVLHVEPTASVTVQHKQDAQVGEINRIVSQDRVRLHLDQLVYSLSRITCISKG